MVLTADETRAVAAALGASVRTVRAWRHEPGFPSASPPDVVAIAEWVRAMRATARERQSRAMRSSRSAVTRDLDARLKEIRIELDTLKLERAKATVHDVARCEAERSANVAAVVADLYALPPRVCPQLAGLGVHEMEDVLESFLKRICDTYARNASPWRDDPVLAQLAAGRGR